ncbi:MAG TPA: hypothetical protein ENL27_00935 [Candidatus Parcubacteria bacterium]|nr:hypothetical protein [Candidatus Parcubacteria bacterium]
MRKIISAFSLIIFISAPGVSLAAGLVPCDLYGDDACTFCDFFILFDNIFRFLLSNIVPPLAILMISWGGFLYITNMGNPDKVGEAKKIFISVVYGLLIIYGAWLAVNLFFQVIGVAEWTGLTEGWWKINCK